jgi:geranylgeranyl pyrophosphate synthase
MAFKDATQYEMETAVTEQVDAAELIDRGLQEVEALMHQAVDTDVTVLKEASRHIISSGGKRIRPRVVLAAYIACGGEDVQHTLAPAAALELVHTASVVHDDINDHGVLRRGKPSVNAVWGRTFALLTGDFLFTKVYELMAPYQDLNIVLADATVALVEGETLQASAVKENNLSRKMYLDIIARKTAALFQAGGVLGARLANATPQQVEALGRFGFNIGIAFQIVDDILDLVGDSATIGKTAGLDREQGKGLSAAYNAEQGETNVMDVIHRKLTEGNAIEEGRQQAHQFMQMALDELAVLPESAGKQALIALAHSTVERMS